MKTKTIVFDLKDFKDLEKIEFKFTDEKVTDVPVPEKTPIKRFYDLNWFIDYTGIPRSSAYQKTSKSTVPFIRRGRKLFFEKTKIDQWLEEGTVKTKAEITEEAEKFLSKKGRRLA